MYRVKRWSRESSGITEGQNLGFEVGEMVLERFLIWEVNWRNHGKDF